MRGGIRDGWGLEIALLNTTYRKNYNGMWSNNKRVDPDPLDRNIFAKTKLNTIVYETLKRHDLLEN